MVALYSERFLTAIRQLLRTGLCLDLCAVSEEGSPDLPIIEVGFPAYAISPPVDIKGDKGETALVERSTNATRVSLSFVAVNELRIQTVLKSLLRDLHAETVKDSSIIRRKPLEGYDLSFLFTYRHLLSVPAAQLETQFLNVLRAIEHKTSILIDYPAYHQRFVGNALATALLEVHASPAEGSVPSKPNADDAKEKRRKV